MAFGSAGARWAMARQWVREMGTGSVLLLAIGLAACAAAGREPVAYPPPGLGHRVASPHLELFWHCIRPEPARLRLEGVAVNRWSAQEVRFLEFELVGMDAHEHTVSQATGAAQDFLLRPGQTTPFQLELQPVGSEVRFDLYYQYQAPTRDDDAVISQVVSSRLFLLAQQTNRFLARDACSESQHRAR